MQGAVWGRQRSYDRYLSFPPNHDRVKKWDTDPKVHTDIYAAEGSGEKGDTMIGLRSVFVCMETNKCLVLQKCPE